MNKWVGALILWWAITWRGFVAIAAMGLFIFAIDGIFATNEWHNGIGVILILVVIAYMFWLLGGIGQHAINHTYGKSKIEFAIAGQAQPTASWIDGLILQWALFWRNIVIYVLMAIILAFVFNEPLLLNHEYTLSTESGLPAIYGAGKLNTQIYSVVNLWWYIVYILSAWHLLYKVFGQRSYKIQPR